LAVCLATFLCLLLSTCVTLAQDPPSSRGRLSPDYFKNGDETLEAFASISRAARSSVLKLDLDGNTVALAAVIDANGLAVTKASEIKEGKLTAWLANGKEVPAQLLSRDDENDVALVKVKTKGLKPIRWATNEASVGQWVITPGVSELPQAVGIISVQTRKILHARAFIGVQLDQRSSKARVERVMPGLGAEKAGLKAGDVIVAVNDDPLKEDEPLPDRLRKFREGQTVKLRVKRDDEEFDASVEMRTPNGEGWFGRSDRMDQMGSLISKRAEGFELAIQHDTVLEAWQCGGPLLNLDGKAVGLNIARAARIASYALAADVVKSSIEKLKTQVATQDKGKFTTSQSRTPN
jgi:serine protease Do